MTILNFGTDIGDFEITANANGVYESETTASRLAAQCSNGIRISGFYPEIQLPLTITAQSELWVSAHLFDRNTTADESLIDFVIGGEIKWRVTRTGTGTTSTLDVQVWNGSTWDIVGTSTGTIGIDTLERIDVRLNISDTGNFDLYLNGTSEITFSGDTLRDVSTTCDEVRFNGQSGASSEYVVWSGVFISTTDVTGLTPHQLTPDGNGNSGQWTNHGFGVIDDTGIPNDGDIIHTGTTLQISQFTLTNLDVAFSSETVEAVAVKCRATSGITASLELGTRSGTTDGWGTVQSVGISWSPYVGVFATNPDTAAAWTYAEVNSMNVGVRSTV